MTWLLPPKGPMPPRNSSKFVIGVEAEEGVEGNLNYFCGRPKMQVADVLGASSLR